MVAGSGDRGWLDGSLEHHNWLKLIQLSPSRSSANLKYYLQSGQVRETIPEDYLHVKENSFDLKISFYYNNCVFLLFI